MIVIVVKLIMLGVLLNPFEKEIRPVNPHEPTDSAFYCKIKYRGSVRPNYPRSDH